MKIISSEIIINAPIKLVWEVLSDFDKYPTWNPFTPTIEVSPEIGSTVVLHVKMNPNSNKIIKQKETLLKWEEGTQIDWGIQGAWHVNTVRIQQLTSLDDQTTKYFTSDSFTGPMTWLVMWLYRNKIQSGFDSVAKALKVCVEGTCKVD